jgi:glycosyltransferase involved in cell wall biosynthesis
LDQRKLIDFYSEMDVLVSNSFSESFGLTIAEAAAAGVPSLVLEGSGSSELVINNETGFLFKNQTELVRKLLYIINSVSLRQKIGQNAKLFAVNNWHIEKVVKKYDKQIRYRVMPDHSVSQSVLARDLEDKDWWDWRPLPGNE